MGAGPRQPAGAVGEAAAGRSSISSRCRAAAPTARSAQACSRGWTASGKRPEFDLVTGVSTGALTAPFAFLGPKYDEALKKVFTESNTKDIAIMQPVRGLLGGDSLASNAPLAKVVAFYVNDAFLAEVADGAPQGAPAADRHHQSRRRAPGDLGHGGDRRLGQPEALELFRKVLLASAAIPAVFPPGFVKVPRAARL